MWIQKGLEKMIGDLSPKIKKQVEKGITILRKAELSLSQPTRFMELAPGFTTKRQLNRYLP